MWHDILILLKVSRPPLWGALPLVFCLGLAYGKRGLTSPDFQFAPLMLLQILMLSFPICLITFGLNDIHDYASDRINPRKRGMEGIFLPAQYHKLVGRTALAAAVVFFAVSLATLSPPNVFFTMTLLVLSYVYSTPPWRLKTKPPLDAVVAGIIGFMSPFSLGYSFVDDATALPLHAYLFTFCVMSLHAFSTIMDYDVDKISGDRTFAVAFGKRTAALLPAVIFLFAIYFIHVIYVKVFFVLCIVLFLVVFFIPSERMARYAFLSIFIGAIIVVSIWIGELIIHLKRVCWL